GPPLALPLPAPAGALTTCVQNTWSAPASGTVDRSDGSSTNSGPLFSDVYITGNNLQPCPRCYSGGSHVVGSPSSPASGMCDRGPREGLACTSQNSVGLTNDCPTGGMDATHPCGPNQGCIDGQHAGLITVNLSPLQTARVESQAAAGIFCLNQGNKGCFHEPNCTKFTETGQKAGPVMTGVPADATLAATFCIPVTAAPLVNQTASLPGPGAISLPG